MCENCGDAEATLHIHHAYYEKGLAPWEYSDDSLHCLCEECHKQAQDKNALLQKQIGKLGFGGNIEQLIGYACALESREFPMVPVNVFSWECAKGVGDCWGLTAEEVIRALEESTIDGYKLDQLSRGNPKRDR